MKCVVFEGLLSLMVTFSAITAGFGQEASVDPESGSPPASEEAEAATASEPAPSEPPAEQPAAAESSPAPVTPSAEPAESAPEQNTGQNSEPAASENVSPQSGEESGGSTQPEAGESGTAGESQLPSPADPAERPDGRGSNATPGGGDTGLSDAPRDGRDPLAQGRGPQRGDVRDRNDSDRSRMGISVGPGGVQIFRGDPRFGGPGYRGWPDRSRGRGPFDGRDRFDDRDRWGREGPRGNAYSPYYWNSRRRLGIYIAPRSSNPVIVDRPAQVPATRETPATPEPPAASEEHSVPTEEELAGMPGAELRGLLLYAVDRLDHELAALSTGESWQGYLRIDELRRLVPAPSLAPPPPDQAPDADAAAEAEPLLSESDRHDLSAILEHYDSANRDSEYGQISSLWGFQTTRLALRELLVPQQQRLRKQLSLSVELLEQELKQFETGETWQKFLRLEDLKAVAAKPAEELTASDRRTARDIVSTFDSVAGEPRYRMVSDLLGFHMTQHAVRAWVAQLNASTPPPAPQQNPAANR